MKGIVWSCNEYSKVIDEIVVEHRRKDGTLIRRHVLNSGLKHRILKALHLATNCISNVGMAELANITIGAGTAFTYMAIGQGTTADNAGATGLVDESKRKVCSGANLTRCQSGTGPANDSAEWIAQFDSTVTSPHANDTDAINEVAIFNGSSTGIMLLKVAGGTNYGAVDTCHWSLGDTLTITIKCQMKQG